jgi:hypothetical protein
VQAAVQERFDARQPVPAFMRDVHQRLRELWTKIEAGELFKLPFDTSMPNPKKLAFDGINDGNERVETDELKNITAALGDMHIGKASDAVQEVDVDELKNITAALGDMHIGKTSDAQEVDYDELKNITAIFGDLQIAS